MRDLGIAAPLLAFGIAALGTQLLARTPARLRFLLDQANARSLHQGAIPRTGGIALFIGLSAGLLLLWGADVLLPSWPWLASALLLVALVSLWDDAGEVHPLFRLFVQTLAALVLLAGGLRWSPLALPGLSYPPPDFLAELLTLLYLLWHINLYNFMDGMDGLAGGMALFGFGTLGFLGWQAGALDFALVNGLIAAAAAGFLTGNLPPARIFLGDLGSTGLGLLAGALSLLGAQQGLFPLWVAWLIFSPFLWDATWTLLRRALRGEVLWQPHRSHHYQRLVLAGWSQRKTLGYAYALMLACSLSALAALHMSVKEQAWLMGAWVCVYGLLSDRVERVASHEPLV